jgi:hypothetical protein
VVGMDRANTRFRDARSENQVRATCSVCAMRRDSSRNK